MVGRRGVEEDARHHCRGDQPHPRLRKRNDKADDVGEHSAGFQHPAEADGAEDDPHGVEHSRHAPCGQQVVDGREAAVYRCGAEAALHRPLEQHDGRGMDVGHAFGGHAAHLSQDMRLEDGRKGYGCQRRGEEYNDGRHLLVDHHARGHRHKEKPKAEVEL